MQWHHTFTSAGYPANNLSNLEFNIMWDGFFHMSTYLFTATGLTILRRKARQPHALRSGKMLVGAMLMGFGIFNFVEGTIDHQLLGRRFSTLGGSHVVRRMVPVANWTAETARTSSRAR